MIEEDLPALACTSCEGSLVSLLYYRHWVETHQPIPSAATAQPTASVETSDTMIAMPCPKCARLMTKYKLTGNVSNRVDLCGLCDEAWLDRGEWELLDTLHLSHNMPAIFTDEWQRKIRRELSEGTRRAILTRIVGAEGAAKVEEFRAWLTQTKHKSHIMTYLYKS
jgi:Zn-finger nucleic acid-binding protein